LKREKKKRVEGGGVYYRNGRDRKKKVEASKTSVKTQDKSTKKESGKWRRLPRGTEESPGGADS